MPRKIEPTPADFALAAQVRASSPPSGRWDLKAECGKADRDAAFSGENTDKRRLDDAQFIKTFCGKCSVRAACLYTGVTNPNRNGGGVWGGKSSEEIRRVQVAYRKGNAKIAEPNIRVSPKR